MRRLILFVMGVLVMSEFAFAQNVLNAGRFRCGQTGCCSRQN
jgi:hypothetical protein